MYVRPAYRRDRIGGRLVDEFRAWAKESGRAVVPLPPPGAGRLRPAEVGCQGGGADAPEERRRGLRISTWHHWTEADRSRDGRQ
ncbi:hypothetical protein [Streptomyces mirabilis]